MQVAVGIVAYLLLLLLDPARQTRGLVFLFFFFAFLFFHGAMRTYPSMLLFAFAFFFFFFFLYSSHENGVCVARDGPQSLCAAPSGIRVEGLCPASQICCLRAVRSSERSCDASGYTCMNVEVTMTECPTQQLSSGMCPGSSSVQCCIH